MLKLNVRFTEWDLFTKFLECFRMMIVVVHCKIFFACEGCDESKTSRNFCTADFTDFDFARFSVSVVF